MRKVEMSPLLAQNTELAAAFADGHQGLGGVETMPGVRERHELRVFLWRWHSREWRRQQLRRDHLALVLFLFAIDAVFQRPAFVLDGDLAAARFSDFDVRAAHRIRRALGLDLVDHIAKRGSDSWRVCDARRAPAPGRGPLLLAAVDALTPPGVGQRRNGRCTP
jgi:hypothetical protein